MFANNVARFRQYAFGGPPMRTMYDGVNPATLPPNGDIYAGYVDGKFANLPEMKAAFPGKLYVGIAVSASTNNGRILDVENGDATPAQVPQWLAMRRAAGVVPCVYTSLAQWTACKVAVSNAGMLPPLWWIADWKGTSPHTIPGAVAVQWESTPGYDQSVVADYWPGLDPAPAPPTPPTPNPTTIQLPTGATVHPIGITVETSNSQGWAALPVPAAKVFNAIVADENPDTVNRYDNVPVAYSIASEAGPHSPNGAIVLKGGTSGTYGVTLWVLT
jgi:hypothetical protein